MAVQLFPFNAQGWGGGGEACGSSTWGAAPPANSAAAGGMGGGGPDNGWGNAAPLDMQRAKSAQQPPQSNGGYSLF